MKMRIEDGALIIDYIEYMNTLWDISWDTRCWLFKFAWGQAIVLWDAGGYTYQNIWFVVD